MINNLFLAVLVASVAAGPCRPGTSGPSSDIDSTTIDLTTTDSASTTSSTIINTSTTVAFSTESAKTTDAAETTTSVDATTSENACILGINGANGQPPRESRLSDCSALYTVTVSPYAITSTVVRREIAIRIPTGRYTGQPIINTLAARAEEDPTATTIQPTEIPQYATYCDSSESYYEACSRAGITGFTTTLTTPTSTSETTITDCPGRRLVRRAGEAMGYEFEDNWDAYNMPGYRLF
ncbi:hypothetical protein NW762_013092 [Fusarium torreyae]|uniref:Uncharacterized protein n=1 Tax=Fusarium torreyae TaxID=1237075 RepID=A0A9W8RNZ4_9HYPO|nr:hypothetical protein NW762_013092 [Fusarium torreyae]